MLQQRMAMLTLTALLPQMFVVTADQSFRVLMEPVIPWFFTIEIFLVLLSTYPVLILRYRVRDKKQHELGKVYRWEWPIASHLQKLILFGLLPPLTWVVAAMIENTIY
jgi:hypothetical protein